tara:strand:- start:428 stop:949 length:522 start_codon:yes stop_codon:yes gene_type:complete
MDSAEGMFMAPVPGMGLTEELGATPWQHPPQYATVEEALDFYTPRILNPDMKPDLLNVMEMGIPLTTIAQGLQMGGVMQGKHSIDVGVLVTPVLIELLAYVADTEGVEYNTGIKSTKIDEDKISDTEIGLAMQKIPDVVEETERKIKQPEPMEEPMETEPEEAEPMGLMARRQ